MNVEQKVERSKFVAFIFIWVSLCFFIFLFTVPTNAPTNVTAITCNWNPLCLLVSWQGLPSSYVESLNGVFQGYNLLYSEEGEPFTELFVPLQETERHEVQLIDLKCYTNYTIQVLVVTLNGPGFPSSAVTGLTGESGKQHKWHKG